MSSVISQSFSIFEDVGGLGCKSECLGRVKGTELEPAEDSSQVPHCRASLHPEAEKRPPVPLDEL